MARQVGIGDRIEPNMDYEYVKAMDRSSKHVHAYNSIYIFVLRTSRQSMIRLDD